MAAVRVECLNRNGSFCCQMRPLCYILLQSLFAIVYYVFLCFGACGMIKAEVGFDGQNIIIGKYRIEFGLALIFIFIGDKVVRKESNLEQAIKYCVERNQ